MRNRKGQITIYGILQVVLLLMVFTAVIGTIVSTIATASANLSTTEKIVLGLVPLAMIIGIVGGIQLYSQPQYQR